MGQIGRFIDAACRRRPDLMRQVLDRTFGDLAWFVEFDEHGETCGCLVGTMGLVSGAAVTRECRTPAIRAAARLAGVRYHQADEIGMAVWALAERVTRRSTERSGRYSLEGRALAHATTSELLKRRIARRLGVTSLTVARPAMAETEPAHA